MEFDLTRHLDDGVSITNILHEAIYTYHIERISEASVILLHPILFRTCEQEALDNGDFSYYSLNSAKDVPEYRFAGIQLYRTYDINKNTIKII